MPTTEVLAPVHDWVKEADSAAQYSAPRSEDLDRFARPATCREAVAFAELYGSATDYTPAPETLEIPGTPIMVSVAELCAAGP